MRPIRILHVSDLHLAEQPQRHSILDRSTAVKAAIRNLVASVVKDAILAGQPGHIKAALKNLLDDKSISALVDALSHIDREKVNERIDAALKTTMESDFSFEAFVVQTLKDLTIASSYNSGALDCLCNFVEDEEDNLDAIIITGDLATTGFDADLEKGRIFLEGTGLFEQTISHAKAPKMLLPGNHDRYIYTGRGFLFAPGGTRFDQILQNHWSGPIRAYGAIRDGKDLSVVVLAADFSLRSKNDCTLPFMKLSRLAQGRVYRWILDDLVKRTQVARQKERADGYTPVTLWAIHFPPSFLYQGASKVAQTLNDLTKNLIDEDELVDEAKEHFVDAILAGHTHEPQDYMAGAGAMRVLCAGTTTQDDVAEKQCQIIEVSRNSIDQPRIINIEYLQDEWRSTFTLKTYPRAKVIFSGQP
jgi:3',5'-cyclic AMP phosphodiesterase CpdA